MSVFPDRGRPGFDRRLIDGADAGKSMIEFKKAPENWNRQIL
jgi:pyruvate/2-oxoglutarate dehydrogenase complex dihydrolipoamide acyltransferase (E2) component